MRKLFANSFEFDPAKPLTVAYGSYLHKKTGVKQVINHDTALAWQNNIAKAKDAGAPGLPIYHGHPDVPELAARYPNKAAVGWITSVGYKRTGDTECELKVEWVTQPKPGEFIYFSPWMGGYDSTTGTVQIDELQSVGLTNRPNDTRFRLPNEAGDDHNNERNTQMKKVLALLHLEDTATEDDAVAAVQKLIDEREDALRKNETAEAEGKAAKEEAEKAKDESKAAKVEFANERDARIGVLLDSALSEGRITPATKAVWEGRLRRNFANELEALGKITPSIKTRTALSNELDTEATSASGILAKYEAMPEGNAKDEFFRANVLKINEARVAQEK